VNRVVHFSSNTANPICGLIPNYMITVSSNWNAVTCKQCLKNRAPPRESLHDEAMALIEQYERTAIPEEWRAYHELGADLMEIPQ
jgi:hypothetical protein